MSYAYLFKYIIIGDTGEASDGEKIFLCFRLFSIDFSDFHCRKKLSPRINRVGSIRWRQASRDLVAFVNEQSRFHCDSADDREEMRFKIENMFENISNRHQRADEIDSLNRALVERRRRRGCDFHFPLFLPPYENVNFVGGTHPTLFKSETDFDGSTEWCGWGGDEE